MHSIAIDLYDLRWKFTSVYPSLHEIFTSSFARVLHSSLSRLKVLFDLLYFFVL